MPDTTCLGLGRILFNACPLYRFFSGAFSESSKLNQTDQLSNNTRVYTFIQEWGEILLHFILLFQSRSQLSFPFTVISINPALSSLDSKWEMLSSSVFTHFGEPNLTLKINKGVLQLVTSSRRVTLAILKIMDYQGTCWKSVYEYSLKPNFLYYLIF